MKIKEWVCDFCGQDFDVEVDLLAHQLNSSCEPEEETTLLETNRKTSRQDAPACQYCTTKKF